MAHPLKLPALGALAVAGAAFGLHLGQSAIADINPIHFQGPALHPRERGAAIDGAATTPVQSNFALAYGWDQGANARSAECPGCSGPGTPYTASGSAYVSEADYALAAPAPAPRPAVFQRREEERPDGFTADYAQADRYAHYQIEEAAVEDEAAGEGAPAEEPAYSDE